MERKQKIGIGTGIALAIAGFIFVLIGVKKETRKIRLDKIKKYFKKE